MTQDRRKEAEDLEALEVLDASDTLDGDPGEDPLDTGVIAPDRWSPAMRFGSTAGEQSEGESLDRLLGEEEPDGALDPDDGRPSDLASDENATDDEVSRNASVDGPDPRAGRLVTEEELAYVEGDLYLAARDDLTASDAGIDGGGASAEEAAVHVENGDDGGLGGNQ